MFFRMSGQIRGGFIGRFPLELKVTFFVCLCLLLTHCATPISPTGGPPDEAAPVILFTQPETGTVNFSSNKIILHFDDFVNRNSFENALRIEPAFGLNYELDWGRHSVAIEFKNQLPDSTTFIVTVGTEFSDLSGNSLGSPVKIAVSTGPAIDKGKIIGKVLDARTGESRKGERVLLYRLPADLSKPANYIAETDTAGVVRFSYLRQGDYLAFWVDDRNRNAVWDQQTERAQPFSKKIISLEKEGSDTLGTLFIAKSDTSSPALRGIGLFSKQRLRLRFSENIVFTDSSKIIVTDTLGNFYAAVYPLYLIPDQKYILFAHSKKDLIPNQNYSLVVQNIADEAGNLIAKATESFTGSAQTDTTSQRIIYAGNEKGIYPEEGVKITYAKPISNPAIRDSVIVVTADTAFTDWSNLRIQQNVLLVLPNGQWEEGVEYEIRVWNPFQQNYKKIQPKIWFPSDLGSLNLTFTDSTSQAAQRATQLLLKAKDGRIVADTSFTSQVTIDELPPVTYQLILYQDLNNNGEWDSGQVQPYVAPEPYYIRDKISIEPGFTAELSVNFES